MHRLQGCHSCLPLQPLHRKSEPDQAQCLDSRCRKGLVLLYGCEDGLVLDGRVGERWIIDH